MKTQHLKRIEQEIQQQWIETNSNNTALVKHKKKYFATFPFPYMNGRLHAGHMYTISKVEFTTRYKELCGYNVLFPFGFHGTGTPIVACANKLRKALESFDGNYLTLPMSNQIKILYNMGVEPADIPRFVDPNYWIEYFPTKALEDLKLFGVKIDTRRSFVTTSINKYFDSFVKWQFNKLYKQGLLQLGEKHIIYSPLDKQPCSDHDRSIGEGVKIAHYILLIGELNDNTSLMFKSAIYCPTKLLINKNTQFVKFTQPGSQHIYITAQQILNNLSYQKFNHTVIGVVSIADIIGKTIFIKSLNKSINIISTNHNNKTVVNKVKLDMGIAYYEPEKEVISRSGSRCVVALVKQWFIDYGDESLTKYVNNYIANDLDTYNENVKNAFIKSSDWLDKWACSRKNGLGTQLLDTEYMIDSLSDSTIHMAYYTIGHLIERLPLDIVINNDNLWEYIFCDGVKPLGDNATTLILDEMKNEFNYWYPLDLRVSGHDLISNHLTMSLYNHAAIWNNDNHRMPKSYFVNGHIMINGDKMSKSKGNFLTLHEVITKYGADATRLTLAMAGSGRQDANFSENHASSNVVKIHNEYTWCINKINQLSEKIVVGDNYINRVFCTKINHTITSSRKCMNELDFVKAVKYGFFDLVKIKKTYRLNEYSRDYIYYIQLFLLALYPFCPHVVEKIWNHGLDKGIVFKKLLDTIVVSNDDKKILWQLDVIDNIKKKCNLVKNNPCKIHLHQKVDDIRSNLINSYISLNGNMRECVKLHNKNKKYVKYICYIHGQVAKYGHDWLTWIFENDLNKAIRTMLPTILFKQVVFVISDPGPFCKWHMENPLIN